MRRLALTCAFLVALALPTSGLALYAAPGDGTLVVRGADNGDGAGSGARPVVTVVINGFAIGQISGEGRIAIYDLDPTDANAPEVTGATWHRDVQTKVGDTTLNGTTWGGTGPGFKFRAIGTYRIVIYGSGVYVFSSGHGRVWFNGQPDPTANDGQYSLDGKDFVPIPLKGSQLIGVSSNG